jgi:hypothetical protein
MALRTNSWARLCVPLRRVQLTEAGMSDGVRKKRDSQTAGRWKLALFKVVSITYKNVRLTFMEGDQPATGISISRSRIFNVRSAA